LLTAFAASAAGNQNSSKYLFNLVRFNMRYLFGLDACSLTDFSDEYGSKINKKSPTSKILED